LTTKMAERYTAETVLELLRDDFDVSEGEESDFEDNGVYSYLPEASTSGVDLTEPVADLTEPEADLTDVNQSESEGDVDPGDVPSQESMSKSLLVH